MTEGDGASGRTGSTDPVGEFVAVMRRLQVECSWKATQTHESLARYLLEETYETLEVLDSGDPVALREELGDLLLQVVLHSVMAERDGEFTFDEVVTGITAKMVRRNPHVFATGEGQELSPEEVDELYQRAKDTEKQRGSVLEGIPAALPALLHADKVAERLARAGQPLTVASRDAVAAEQAEDVGEALLALVLRARAEGTDPEQALRRAVARRVSAPGA
ncbi:MAG: MazG nucleotide pyrophosphohydrolase domain-containing protein [Nocardioides sp.]|uniref:MazG nucleotide pyrophosphohydrolase domain-containing protein n=1 Tax=Nocardioides sp. TaxID=35761 RepID=UPI003F0B3665